jgi:hypothetical protein
MPFRRLLSLGISALLAVPAWAGRAPTIHDQYEEPMERDWTRDPSKRHIPGLTAHLGDLITDRGPRQDDVPGVDHFVDGLQEALRKGSDVPRWKVLRNAKEGRDNLRDAYDELRKALEPLMEARRILREAGDVLVPAVQGEVEDAAKVKESAHSVKQGADAIETDPPEAKGPKPDASAVASVKPRAKDLASVAEKLALVAKELEKAKPWSQRAKLRVQAVDIISKEAKKLEEEIVASLGQRRTRGTTEDLSPAFNSEKVLLNANKFLKEASKRVEKLIERLEGETAPDEGLGKLHALAMAADGKNMAGRAAARRGAAKVTGEAAKVKDVVRPEWDAADALPEPEKEKAKREAVEKAVAAKTAADEAAKAAVEAAEAAEAASRAADAQLSKAAQQLKKLEDELGPEPSEDLPDLPDLTLDAPEPKLDAKAKGRRGASPKVRSKPLRYPKVLDDAPDRVIGEYGEGDYGRSKSLR